MLASSSDDIWSVPYLVDVTVDKMSQLAKMIQRLPSYDARVKTMEQLSEGYVKIIKAALLCHKAIASMAQGDDHSHSYVPDSIFIALFRAAVQKVFRNVDKDASQPTLQRRSSSDSLDSPQSRTPSHRIPSAVSSRGSSGGLEEPDKEPVPASFVNVDPNYPAPPSPSSFLSTFISMLSAQLTPTRTQALRLIVSLDVISDKALRSNDNSEQDNLIYSSAELGFIRATFNQGVMGFGAEDSLAMAGINIGSPRKASSAVQTAVASSNGEASADPSNRAPSNKFLSKIRRAVQAAAMSKILKGAGQRKSSDAFVINEEEEEEEDQPISHEDPSHVSAWLSSVTPGLHWLETLFPKQDVFKGIEAAVKAGADHWHQALHSQSQSCGFLREGEGLEEIVGPYSWRKKLGSLHWLLLVAVAVPHRFSVACEALLCQSALGGSQESMTPGDSLLVALQSTPASCPLLLTSLGCSDPIVSDTY